MVKCLTTQYEFRNSVLSEFGFDQTGDCSYEFNSQGFRDEEFLQVPDIIFAGGSISFGIGIDKKYRYGNLVSDERLLSSWNISYAQEYYNNEIIFQTLISATTVGKISSAVVQWVSDKRQSNTEKNVYEYIDLTNKMFDNAVHILIDGRDDKEEIKANVFDLINPPWVDKTAGNTHPGKRTHIGLAKFILKKLYD